MARQKTQAKRKSARRADTVTMSYGNVVFYVIIGLIIGMAIGALALLWVVRIQSTQASLEASLRSQYYQQR